MNPESDFIVVESAEAPTIEVDTTAQAAYVRFRKGKVARTVRKPSNHCFIAIDFDRSGRVLGVEVIGETIIEIAKILKAAAIKAPNVDYSRVRYKSMDLVTA